MVVVVGIRMIAVIVIVRIGMIAVIVIVRIGMIVVIVIVCLGMMIVVMISIGVIFRRLCRVYVIIINGQFMKIAKVDVPNLFGVAIAIDCAHIILALCQFVDRDFYIFTWRNVLLQSVFPPMRV